MKKISTVCILITASLFLAGCSRAKIENSTTAEESMKVEEPTASPESMMNAPLATSTPQETPVDISVDAQLKSTKPVGMDDDPKTIKSDLNNTTVVNESFN